MHRQCAWGIWMEGDFVLLDRGGRCAHDRHSILDSERIQLAAQMYSTVYVKAGNGVPSIFTRVSAAMLVQCSQVARPHSAAPPTRHRITHVCLAYGQVMM